MQLLLTQKATTETAYEGKAVKIRPSLFHTVIFG